MKRSCIFTYLFIAVCTLIAIFPFLFVFTNSFMSMNEITNRYTKGITSENKNELHSDQIHFVNTSLIPKNFSLEQYKNLFFENTELLRYLGNSVRLVIPIIIGQCLIAPLGAFGFENLNFKFKEIIFFIYIIVMLMPMQLLMVPNFIVAGWLNIRNSYLAIILPAMFHPVGIFLLRQQIKGFPKETLEAARIDGAGEFTVFRKIMRPNIASTIAALVVLLFADNWNIVDQAVVFIQDASNMPMSVMLNQIAGFQPQIFFAVSCIFVAPALLVFFFGQDYLVEGISLSGIKL